MHLKNIYVLVAIGFLVGCFASASYSAEKGHEAPLDAIEPIDEQNYGYVTIENLPSFVDRSKLFYPKLMLAGQWLGPGETSKRIKEGIYCIELSQRYFSSKFCDVKIKPKITIRYDIWKKLSVVQFERINVPHWEDSTPFTQLKGSLAGANLKLFAEENQGKQFFYNGNSIQIEFNQFYPTKQFSLKVGELNKLILDMPQIATPFSIYQAPYGIGSRLPLVNIQTDKTYYRRRYEVPSHESRLTVGWKLGGGDKQIEHHNVDSESSLRKYSKATNHSGWLFPRKDLIFVFHDVEYPIRFDKLKPINIVLPRIDVKHIKIKREDSRIDTIEGFYAVEYFIDGQWKHIYLPHYIYNNRLDAMILHDELHNEMNLEHPEGPYYKFPTNRGLDVLPGFLYRITLNYELDGDAKLQTFTLDYR